MSHSETIFQSLCIAIPGGIALGELGAPLSVALPVNIVLVFFYTKLCEIARKK